MCTSMKMKVEATLLACTFSVIEATFWNIFYGKYRTTFAQWWINVLTVPVFITGYQGLLSDFALARLLLMPLNVWKMETVQAAILRSAYYGINPAWDYSNDHGSLINGSINLRMWPEWLLLGVALELKSSVERGV